VLAAMMMAPPAMAQVDWVTIFAGETGANACPPGKSEKFAHLATVKGGSLTYSAATISTSVLTLGNIRLLDGRVGSNANVFLEVKERGLTTYGSPVSLGNTSGTIAAKTSNYGGLKRIRAIPPKSERVILLVQGVASESP